MAQQREDQRFFTILESHDRTFEVQRKILFANPVAVEALAKHFDDADRVVAFAARELHAWANAGDHTYTDLATFLAVTEPQLKRADKSAKGGGGSAALFRYLSPFLKNEPAKADRLMRHLLFRSFMQPNEYNYIFSVLLQYYAAFQTPEPEVWINASLARSQIPHLFDYIVASNLVLVEPARLKQAMDQQQRSAMLARRLWPD